MSLEGRSPPSTDWSPATLVRTRGLTGWIVAAGVALVVGVIVGILLTASGAVAAAPAGVGATSGSSGAPPAVASTGGPS